MSIHAFIVSRLHYYNFPLAADTWWSFMTSWWRKISLSNSPWKGHCSKYSFMSLCYFSWNFRISILLIFEKNKFLKLFNGIGLLKLVSFFFRFLTHGEAIFLSSSKIAYSCHMLKVIGLIFKYIMPSVNVFYISKTYSPFVNMRKIHRWYFNINTNK